MSITSSGAGSGGSKRLSIVITGRDDDYFPDFRYRITTSLNYLSRNVQRLARLDDIEVLVVDWGSQRPLSTTLVLSADAARICRFVYVPRELAAAARGGGDGFHVSLAANTGVRRAAGVFIMVSAADLMVPEQSLDVILKLLDGRLGVPLPVDQTYFLCRRHDVPWDFVCRQPDLPEWDQYLLLNPTLIKHDTLALFCLGKGAGALMMHRTLWHELRAFDERVAGWGGSDFELAMRIARRCPWIDPSSLGVMLFHMGHPPVGRRANLASIRESEDKRYYIAPSTQVNADDWGLGSHDLEIQIPVNVSDPARGRTLEGAGGDLALWTQSRRELLAETGSAPVQRHVGRVLELLFLSRWRVEPRDVDALFLLSWYGLLHPPRRYLEFGIRRGHGAAVVASACPYVEIYGIEEWQGSVRHLGPQAVASFLYRSPIGYRGYSRFVTGDMATALDRLRRSFVGPFSFDLVLVREECLGEQAIGQTAAILPYLTPGGALILTSGSPARFVPIWKEVQGRFPGLTYLHCAEHGTGLVLAASLSDVDPATRSPRACFLRSGWLWFSRTKCEWNRLSRALSTPARYREFALRGYRRLREVATVPGDSI